MKYDMINSSFKNIVKLIKHNPYLFEVYTKDDNIYKLRIQEKLMQGKFYYTVQCERLDKKNDQWIEVLAPIEESENDQESLISALNWLNGDK